MAAQINLLETFKARHAAFSDMARQALGNLRDSLDRADRDRAEGRFASETLRGSAADYLARAIEFQAKADALAAVIADLEAGQ